MEHTRGINVNLREWRATRQTTWTLPACGLEVTTRKVDLLTLAASGEIPETLNALAQRAADQGFALKDMAEFMPLVDLTVRECLVTPAIGDEADDSHVLLKELPLADRMAIFNWANGVANSLAPFRAEPETDVEPARAGGDVSPAAEPDSEHS